MQIFLGTLNIQLWMISHPFMVNSTGSRDVNASLAIDQTAHLVFRGPQYLRISFQARNVSNICPVRFLKREKLKILYLFQLYSVTDLVGELVIFCCLSEIELIREAVCKQLWGLSLQMVDNDKRWWWIISSLSQAKKNRTDSSLCQPDISQRQRVASTFPRHKGPNADNQLLLQFSPPPLDFNGFQAPRLGVFCL